VAFFEKRGGLISFAVDKRDAAEGTLFAPAIANLKRSRSMAIWQLCLRFKGK
jgi:hypothetical protein